MGFLFFIHAVICVLLIIVILMQSGRGGGLTEGFAKAESVFGAQTNAVMIKATTILAGIFILTCLGVAVLSAKRDRSLMAGVNASKRMPITMPAAIPVAEQSSPQVPSASEGTSAAPQAVPTPDAAQ